MDVPGKPHEGRKNPLRPARYVRLPPDLDDAVARMAEREDRELGRLLRQLIREAVEARIGIRLAS